MLNDYLLMGRFVELPKAPRSVWVKRGCVFYGYEDDYEGGRVVVVDAYRPDIDLADVRCGSMPIADCRWFKEPVELFRLVGNNYKLI